MIRDRELTDEEIAWMFEKKGELERELSRLHAELQTEHTDTESSSETDTVEGNIG